MNRLVNHLPSPSFSYASAPSRAHARRFALIGFLIAMGAPLGLVALRSLERGEPPWRVLSADLSADWPLYLYMTVSTALAFSIFGAVLGGLLDAQRRLATTDPLTGMANRRYFELTLERELAGAVRARDDLAVLLFDVDNLKRINDEGGHAAGDQALRRVGFALGTACRRADLAARIGGDEFALLAPRVDADRARMLAGRIREALASIPGAPRVSVGVATIHGADVNDATTLMRAADEALYDAKAAGRDCVVVATLR